MAPHTEKFDKPCIKAIKNANNFRIAFSAIFSICMMTFIILLLYWLL